MKAVQLDIFSGEVISSPLVPTKVEVSPEGAQQVLNPCNNCEYKGLCPDDECGALNFPIDGPTPDFMSEEEYLELLYRNDLLGVLISKHSIML